MTRTTKKLAEIDLDALETVSGGTAVFHTPQGRDFSQMTLNPQQLTSAFGNLNQLFGAFGQQGGFDPSQMMGQLSSMFGQMGQGQMGGFDPSSMMSSMMGGQMGSSMMGGDMSGMGGQNMGGGMGGQDMGGMGGQDMGGGMGGQDMGGGDMGGGGGDMA